MPDSNYVPGQTSPGLVIALPGEKAEEQVWSFSGNHYDIPFPFSSKRLPGEATAALEKTLVYLGLVMLLAAVAVIVPVIVLVQFMERKAAGDSTSWVGFALAYIPQVLAKELGVCLGFITIPFLMLCNAGKCMALAFKELF